MRSLRLHFDEVNNPLLGSAKYSAKTPGAILFFSTCTTASTDVEGASVVLDLIKAMAGATLFVENSWGARSQAASTTLCTDSLFAHRL